MFDLTIDDRIKIKEALDMNMSYSEMANYVNRNKSVVLRESKRLGEIKYYDPVLAQQNFESKKKLRGIRKHSENYLKICKEENLL